MSVAAAEMFWGVIGLYLTIGFGVAIVFALWAAAATDFRARGGSILFRIILMPGAALLWPYMVARLVSGRRVNRPIDGREEAH